MAQNTAQNTVELAPALESGFAQVWAEYDDLTEGEVVERIEALAAQLPAGHPVAAFERGCAQDSTGHSDLAVPFYRQALAAGLDGYRRRRAIVQMSSSLRNTGHAEESVRLLRAELALGSDELTAPLEDAVRAALALALVDTGREREAVSVALSALAPHLTRYQRSMANYARLLVEPEAD